MSQIEAEKLFKIAQENYEKKDYLKAQNYFSKVLELYPENLSALRKLALCYFYTKKLLSPYASQNTIIENMV